MERGPSCTVDIGVGDGDVLKHVFFQTTGMKEIFSKFPSHVMLDCTYCVNNCLMPLLSFLVIDGNNESRVDGLPLLGNESREMYETVSGILKRENECWVNVKSFMVDKDMNEVSCLEREFPGVPVELCLFHVMKAMKMKIASLECQKNVKDELRDSCAKCCYARTEAEYEKEKERIIGLNAEFGTYFVDNWDSMRERWVQYSREGTENFSNRTNNRVESYHQKLKSEIPRNAPLDVMFRNLLLIVNTLETEISHRLFANTMRATPTPFPHLQTILTPHAFRQTVDVYNKSERLVGDVSGDEVRIRDGGEEFKVLDGRVYTCKVFVCKRLPCSHILAARRLLQLPVLTEDLFENRFRLDYNPNFVGVLKNVTVTQHLPQTEF